MKFTVSLLLLGVLLGGPARAETPSEYVVVLHGMGRTRTSMALMAGHLRREGTASSAKATRGAACRWSGWPPSGWPPWSARVPAGARVHFVTHSLGGASWSANTCRPGLPQPGPGG